MPFQKRDTMLIIRVIQFPQSATYTHMGTYSTHTWIHTIMPYIFTNSQQSVSPHSHQTTLNACFYVCVCVCACVCVLWEINDAFLYLLNSLTRISPSFSSIVALLSDALSHTCAFCHTLCCRDEES